MSRRTLLWSICALLAFTSVAGLQAQTPPPVMPGELLGSTGNSNNMLISIDPMTGAGTDRFPIGSLGPVTEIRFRDDGVLFGSTGGGSSSIITIDPDTGVETLVGMHSFGAVNAMEFVDGVLYGAFFNPGPPPMLGGPFATLVEIDQTDGSLTEIGPLTGFSPVRGMAYDQTTGLMYGVGTPIGAAGEAPEGLPDQLFTFDLATGATTLVGGTGAAVGIGGMTFGQDGLLYAGGTGGGGELGPGAPLFILDTATGAATLVGDTGSPAISGLAFVPQLGSPVVAIPTASQMGLLLLGALLAAGALFVLRRG